MSDRLKLTLSFFDFLMAHSFNFLLFSFPVDFSLNLFKQKESLELAETCILYFVL